MDATADTHLASRSRKRKQLDSGDDAGDEADACCGMKNTGALVGDSEPLQSKKKAMPEASDSVHSKVDKSRKRKKASLDDDGDCVLQQEEKRLRRYVN